MSFLSNIQTPTANNAVPVNPFAAALANKKPAGNAGATFINPFAGALKKAEPKTEEPKAEQDTKVVEMKPAKPAEEETAVKVEAKAETETKVEVKAEETVETPAESEKKEAAAEKAETKAEAEKVDQTKIESSEESAKVVAAEEDSQKEPEKAKEKEQKEEPAETAKPEPEKKKRRSRRKKATASEAKAETHEEAEETEAPADVEPIDIDNAPEFKSAHTYREGTDILMGALEDGEEDWIKFRDDITARIQKVRIDSDINPGSIKFAMDELDALFTEVRLQLIKTDGAINRIDNKKTGAATIIEKDVLGKLGKVSTAERDYAVQKALIDVPTGGHHLNLLFLLGKAYDRKTTLDGFMSIIDAKKKALITACSVMKTEQQATGAYAS